MKSGSWFGRRIADSMLEAIVPVMTCTRPAAGFAVAIRGNPLQVDRGFEA